MTIVEFLIICYAHRLELYKYRTNDLQTSCVILSDNEGSTGKGRESSEDEDEVFESQRPAKKQKVDSEVESDKEDDEESKEIDVEEDEPIETKLHDKTSDLKNIKVELEGRELWERFNDLGTEMIITKAGR